uniref:Uncharacterized protein n=1 Tax=Oryza punctata TaxID=4537 RepID=A0A0E0KNG7_ORYPU
MVEGPRSGMWRRLDREWATVRGAVLALAPSVTADTLAVWAFGALDPTEVALGSRMTSGGMDPCHLIADPAAMIGMGPKIWTT